MREDFEILMASGLGYDLLNEGTTSDEIEDMFYETIEEPTLQDILNNF